jgi:hypothetical protein
VAAEVKAVLMEVSEQLMNVCALAITNGKA